MSKVVFIDRDGVINKDIGYLHVIDKFEFITGIFDLLYYLQQLNYLLIIITNQSGIGRKYYKLSDFIKLNNWMLAQFKQKNITITDVFFCPHTPYDNCDCRKPKTKMLIDANKKYNINKQKSWLIGDKESDIMCANNFGVNNTILFVNKNFNNKQSKAKYILKSMADIATIIR